MASILDRYGIKEVADVTFYKIQSDGSIGAPVLYLDTLKVSTIEQTAENTSARGGKGNPELITWDYGKEITVTLEDALFSAKSMAIMFGDNNGIETTTTGIKKTWNIADLTAVPTELEHGAQKFQVSQLTDIKYYKINDANETVYADATTDSAGTGVWASGAVYATASLPVVNALKIDINADTFPGTYYVTGDTYARSENTGEDEFFQFIIQKAKVQSEVTLTMEAEGDPSTFSMNLRVLRPKDGKMMQLVKYDFTAAG